MKNDEQSLCCVGCKKQWPFEDGVVWQCLKCSDMFCRECVSQKHRDTLVCDECRQKSDKRKPPDGGPAFPKTGSYSEERLASYDSLDQDGMTLRNWLAGQCVGHIVGGWIQGEYTPEEVAINAYRIADAMIKVSLQ